MTVRLRLFGGLSILREGKPIVGPVAQRRNLALLAVLAVQAREGITRERLAGLLWPEGKEASARGSLKQALFMIRQELGANVVQGTGELRCGLDFPSTDLADFEAALGAGDLEGAVAVWAGPFLDGFHLARGSEDFERWVDAERDRLARCREGALETLASRAEANRDAATAARWWRLLADGAPLDSRYAQGVIRTRAAMGDRAGALQHAELHRQLLHHELGLPPDPDVERLVESVRLPATRPASSTSTPLAAPPSTVGLEAIVPASGSVVDNVRPRRRRGTLAAGALLGAAALVALWVTATGVPPADPRAVAVVEVGADRGDSVTRVAAGGLIEAMARHLIALQFAPVPLQGAANRDVVGLGRGVRAAYVVSILRRGEGITVALSETGRGRRLWASVPFKGGPSGMERLAEQTAATLAAHADPALAKWIDRTTGPSSVASYRDVSHGLALFADLQLPGAIESLLRASRADTAFTMPLVVAGLAGLYAQRPTLVDSVAAALRHRSLPPLERALLKLQAARLSKDLDAEYRAAREIGAAAPGSEWLWLVAESTLKLGRAREAAALLEGLDLNLGMLRGSALGWISLARALHHLGDYDRELATMAEGRRRLPTSRLIAQQYVKAVAAKGDVSAVLAEIDRVLALRPRQGWELQPFDQAIAELWAHGHREGARRVVQRLLGWLDGQDAAIRGLLAVNMPTWAYYSGDLAEARERLRDLGARDVLSPDNLALLAVIAAEQGDRATADSIRRMVVTDSAAAEVRVEALVSRASIAAALGDREAAVDDLRHAMGDGFPGVTVLHIFPGFDALRGFRSFERLAHPVL